MSWNREQVETRVKEVLETNLDVDPAKIRDDSLFTEDLGADSLDEVEIAIELESQFGIEIPDEEAAKIKTFKQAVDTVCAVLKITD